MGACAVGPRVGEQKPLVKTPLWGNPSPEMTYPPTCSFQCATKLGHIARLVWVGGPGLRKICPSFGSSTMSNVERKAWGPARPSGPT